MYRFFCLTCVILSLLFASAAFAKEGDAADTTVVKTTEQSKETASDITDTANVTASPFMNDLKKARDLILGSAGDNSFARGLIVALFQPMFIAAMFCMGLWAGQMSERFKHVWALPVIAFIATVIGAFITTYHSDWKPQFDSGHLKALQSTDVVTVVVGLLLGAAVAMRLILVPVFALAGAIVAGLALGFSQTSDLGEHHNSLLPFWAGFGLTGLLVNIFGIGFETFLQSINLNMVTRWLGLATIGLSFFMGTKIF